MVRPTALTALIAFLAWAAPALADWPHARGPNYDAVSTETGLADEWPAEGPPVLWRRDLGQGYSGFVVAGGRVFTQFQTLAGQFVVCLDPETGAERWRHRYGWPWQPAGLYPGPYATPTWSAGKVYFTAPDGLVGCLDAETGDAIWTVNVLRRFQGRGAGFGYACTPLVEDGMVILPVGGAKASMVALDASDGSTVWQSGNDAGSYSSALPVDAGGRRWVVAFLRNALVAVDLKSGEPRWREEVSTHYDEHSAWPLRAGPNLVVCSPFRQGARCFRLDTPRPEPVWESRELSNDVCSSVHVDGFLYGFDLRDLQANTHRTSRGRFKCLESTTGKVRWSTDKVGHSSVLVADGKLILLDDTGVLRLARLSPDAYHELGRTRVLDGLPCWTPPTLHDGRLFVRDQSRMACLYVGDPDRLRPEQRLAPEAPSSLRWDWSKLVVVEPDYPNDLPTWGEFRLWFAACLACFGLAGAAALVSRSRVVLGCVALVVGAAGTTAVGYAGGPFVLTWPAALFAALQLTVAVVSWAERQGDRRKARRWSRLAGVLFLALCFGYYELCKNVGLATGWTFLMGLLPAYPFAVLAARRSSWWGVVGFVVYYWGSVGFIVWKSWQP